MLLILLFWISLGVPNVTYGRNTIQTDKRTNVDLLKSLIYDNTKATVTLDSSALKQLIQLGSGTDSSTSPRRVSFSVTINESNQVITLGSGQIVKYTKVLTNDGNGYDERTGVFTCPVAGTYMFVVDSLSSGIWLYLKVNKNTVGKIHVPKDPKDNHLIQVSRTVIVKLKAGDHVKVENDGHNSKIHYDMYSGFTGVLLY